MARFRGVLCLVLAAFLATPLYAGERQLKEAELSKLRERIAGLQKDLEGSRGRYAQLRRDLRDSERRVSALAVTLRQLDQSIGKQRDQLARLQSEQAALDASVARQRSHLGDQVRSAYVLGRQEYLKLLLNQQDPSAVGRAVTYYDYLNRARSERIGALAETMERLAAKREEVNAETLRLEALREERAGEKKKLEATRRERAVLVLRLKEDISTKDKRLSGLRGEEQELKRLLEALTDALQDIPAESGGRPFAALRGRLAWPAPGPLGARFGSDRVAGKLRWQGVLIRAAEGQEVRAVSNGRVAFADWLRGYGLLIIVDHGDGYMSLYGHNQSLYKETGAWVRAGEVIATVGDSGGSDSAALYFEIRHNGKPLDPAQWCRKGRG